MKPQQHHAADLRSKACDKRNKLEVSTKPEDRASTAPGHDVRDSWRTGMRGLITRTLGRAEKLPTDESQFANKCLRLTPEIRGQTSVRWLFPLIE